MADLATLTVSGPVTFEAPGTDPNAPVRRADLVTWVPSKPASNTATGTPGQYFADANFLYVCYAVNRWMQTPGDANWT